MKPSVTIRYCTLCISGLLWLWPQQSCGQSLYFRQYTAEQGLPSTEVHDIIQDKNGYIWAATDRGVARFDGYTFETFTRAEGLSDNVVFKVREAADGKIWFGEMSGTLSCYDRGTIRPAPENAALQQHFRHATLPASMEAGKDYIDIGYVGYGIFRLCNGTVQERTPADAEGDIVWASQQDVVYCCKNRLGKNLTVYYEGKRYRFKPPHTGKGHALWALKRRNGDLIVSTTGNIWVFKKKGAIKRYSTKYQTSFFETPDSSLYMVSYKGFCRYNANEDFVSDKRRHDLSDCRITKLIRDRDGGLWVATLNKGILYCAHPGFTVHNFNQDLPGDDNQVSSVCGDHKGKVFVGLKNGSIYSIDRQDSCIPRYISRQQDLPASIGYDTLHDCLLTYFSGARQHIEIPGQPVRNLAVAHPHATVPYRQGYLSGNYHHISLLRQAAGSQQWKNTGKALINPHIVSMLRLTEDSIFAGTLYGLYLFRDWRFLPLLAHTPYAKERINAIVCIGRRTLALATIGKGLLLYDLKTRQLETITSRDGLPSDVINDIALDQKGTLWLAGNKGLSGLTKNAAGRYSIRNYTLYDGLPFTDIKHIHADRHTLYMATSNVVVLFDTESRTINRDPELLPGAVYVNERKVLPQALTELRFYQNNLRISFLSVIPKMLGHVPYRYRLQLEDAKNDRYWIYTREPQLFLSSVEPGRYKLIIQACNNAGQWSKVPLVLPIRIYAPFWRRGWFIACGMLMAAGTLVLLQRLKLQRLRNNARNEKLMLDYQQQALINQVNPHFLFNSMNSIQKYILREDKEQAVSFVSKFAKLMRLGLEQSRESFIPLAKELELLQIYLLLEEQRFGGKVAYRLELQPGLEEQRLMIPPMLIQPFLENAIWHGILNKPGKGTVLLRLYRHEQLLYCAVEDDGVGRQKAMEIKQQQEQTHRSFAININTARLQLLARSLGSPYFFEVIDLKDHQGAPAGTLVTLALPFKYES